MDLTLLTAIVGLLIGLSVASERLVEILEGVIPALSQESPDPIKEGFRKAALKIEVEDKKKELLARSGLR